MDTAIWRDKTSAPKDETVFWGGHWANEEWFQMHLVQYNSRMGKFLYYPTNWGQIYPLELWTPQITPTAPEKKT